MEKNIRRYTTRNFLDKQTDRHSLRGILPGGGVTSLRASAKKGFIALFLHLANVLLFFVGGPWGPWHALTLRLFNLMVELESEDWWMKSSKARWRGVNGRWAWGELWVGWSSLGWFGHSTPWMWPQIPHLLPHPGRRKKRNSATFNFR